MLEGDSDPDGDKLRLVGWSQPAHGKVDCNEAGRCIYTPDSGFTGADTFTYTVSDGHGGTRSATVTVSVLAENDSSTPPQPKDPPAAGDGGEGDPSGGEAATSGREDLPRDRGTPTGATDESNLRLPAGGAPSTEAPTQPATDGGSLPLTGLGLGLVGLLGLGLLATGLAGRLALRDGSGPRCED